MTPGSSIIASPELRCRHGLRRDLSSSALPILPAIRFTRGKYFGASRFTHLLRPAKLLAPLYGSDRHARPPGAFTSRLPTDRLPSPLLDMTTTATGLLCWRDSHPLEWQLASLHLLLHRSGLSPHTPCQSPGALTRVAACTLALSPICDTLIEGFSHFVFSMTAPIASGWSDCRVGLAPTGKAPPCHGAHPEPS